MMKPSGKSIIQCGEDLPKLPDNTEDVDEPQQSEHFETRQSFLNLCQGNHYQFDQLRRAKHSSMMVLYHLHNPDAPKFVPNCSNCKASILGAAWHCRSCDIHFCGDCIQRQGSRMHPHPLQQTGSAPTIVTEEQRRERERSIKLHMQLLNHAANCERCESKNCARMKVR
jgi:E1A/CREB-binding protein